MPFVVDKFKSKNGASVQTTGSLVLSFSQIHNQKSFGRFQI